MWGVSLRPSPCPSVAKVLMPRASSPGSPGRRPPHHRPLSPQLQLMKEKKGLYPDKSVYTQQIGPGLCFGALALMLRFFFEVQGLSLLGVASHSCFSVPPGGRRGASLPPSRHSLRGPQHRGHRSLPART